MSNQSNIFADAASKLFKVGVGAVAAAGEKTKEIVDQLSEKGEETISHYGASAGELGRKVKESADGFAEKVRAGLGAIAFEDLLEGVEKLTEAQREELLAKLTRMKEPAADKEESCACECACDEVCECTCACEEEGEACECDCGCEARDEACECDCEAEDAGEGCASGECEGKDDPQA